MFPLGNGRPGRYIPPRRARQFGRAKPADNAARVEQNAAAMEGDIPPAILDRMTAVSDDVMAHIPDAGNLFRYYP